MLDMTKFAKEVHAVSVEHGWWEGEENNDIDTKIALIHAEWSEALEEYRAGRPMVWRVCLESGDVCMGESCSEWVDGGCELDEMAHKPEGIAVELVDGVIRILDLMAAKEMMAADLGYLSYGECTLPQLVAALHSFVSLAGIALYAHKIDEAEASLNRCIYWTFHWLKAQGVDMDEILRLKHEYNKTRPYRHGGKRC